MSYLLVWHQAHLLDSPSLVAKIFKMCSAKLKLSTVLRSFVKKCFFNTLNPQICYSRRVKSSAAASVCHSQASSVPCNWASSNSAARVTPQASWHKKAISTRLLEVCQWVSHSKHCDASLPSWTNFLKAYWRHFSDTNHTLHINHLMVGNTNWLGRSHVQTHPSDQNHPQKSSLIMSSII